MTDDQKLVLEYLKKLYRDPFYANEFPLTIISYFNRDLGLEDVPVDVLEAYKSLDNKAEFKIFKAFCEWGLKQ